MVASHGKYTFLQAWGTTPLLFPNVRRILNVIHDSLLSDFILYFAFRKEIEKCMNCHMGFAVCLVLYAISIELTELVGVRAVRSMDFLQVHAIFTNAAN